MRLSAHIITLGGWWGRGGGGGGGVDTLSPLLWALEFLIRKSSSESVPLIITPHAPATTTLAGLGLLH